MRDGLNKVTVKVSGESARHSHESDHATDKVSVRIVRLEPALPSPCDEAAKSVELDDRVGFGVTIHALLAKDAEEVQAQRVGEVENSTQRVLTHAASQMPLGTCGVEERIAVALERVRASPQAVAC